MFFFSVLPLPSSLPNPFPSITRGWAHFSNQWMSWSSPALICWFVSSTTGWANSDFISANFPNLSPVGGRDPFQYSPCDSDSASRFRNPLNFPPRIIRDDSASTRPYSYTQSILTRLIQHLLDVWISRKQSSASSARNQFIWLIVKLDATAWGGGGGGEGMEQAKGLGWSAQSCCCIRIGDQYLSNLKSLTVGNCDTLNRVIMRQQGGDGGGVHEDAYDYIEREERKRERERERERERGNTLMGWKRVK